MKIKAFLAFMLAAGVIGLSVSATLFPETEILSPAIEKKQKIVPFNMPHIKQVVQEFAGHPYTEAAVKGLNFGDTQGDRQLRFDGIASTNPVSWSPTLLGLVLPASLSYGHEHAVSIWRNGARISNEFKFMLLRALDGAQPSQGASGQQVTLYGFHLGSSQGGKRLMMSAAVVGGIVSWTDGQIVFRVPAGMAPGTCKLYIMEGNKIVSNKNAFKVL